MQELTFVLGPQRPVADIWETLGAAGIGIEASCTFPGVDGRIVRVVVGDEDATTARDRLFAAGFGPLDQHPVLIVEIASEPGSLGALARKIADGGAHLTTLYMATGNRVVIGSDDLDAVAAIVG